MVLADNGSGALSLNKSGTGRWVLTGASTYTGATTLSDGTLLVNGSLATATVAVNGGTLGGTGTINGIVSVSPGGTISAGASVGTLNTGNQTWNGGATNVFELSSAVSSAGMDLLNITGTLDVQATSGNPFTIKLVSMSDATTPGQVPDFNGSSTYTWTNATASGGILNFDPSAFVVDASAFANSYSKTFSVAVEGNSLVVKYGAALTPPEFSGYGPLSGTSFPLTFSGPSGQSYQVLMSTNVALPLASWSLLSSGTFGGSAVNYTNTSATNALEFYRIQSP
jgi:autotransporter-associated beta strand protein